MSTRCVCTMSIQQCMHVIEKAHALKHMCTSDEQRQIQSLQDCLNSKEFEEAIPRLRRYDVLAIFDDNADWQQCIIVRKRLVVVSYTLYRLANTERVDKISERCRRDFLYSPRCDDLIKTFSVEQIDARPVAVLSVDYGFDYSFKVMRVPMSHHIWNKYERETCRRSICPRLDHGSIGRK